MTDEIILASGSAIRAKILSDAGVQFSIMKPDVDEDAIKTAASAQGVSLPDLAAKLADEKALAAHATEHALVIGSDQILEHQGRAYDKPKSLEEAAERLEILQGDVHTLLNAVSIARGGRILWRHLDRPQLHMRKMTRDEIDRYVDEAGPAILSSVGGYQVERLGARLFNRIDGDFYAVLGLSLYPTLRVLREYGALGY